MSSVTLQGDKIDLTMHRNAHNVLQVTITDGTNAIDISSDDVDLNVFEPDGSIGLTKSSAAGAHDDGANGIVELVLAASDWSEFKSGLRKAPYEVRRTDTSGREFVHIYGTITLEDSTTDRW